MDDNEEKRMAGEYEIIEAMHIGDKEILVGVIEKDNEAPKYMCCYCVTNELFSEYTECLACTDYAEIMNLFAKRLQNQAENVITEYKNLTVPISRILPSQCYPLDYKQSIDGKVVAIKLSSIRREYQTADNQIVLITGGFGSAGNSRGRACYTTKLYDGIQSRWDRSDIQGEIKPEHLPEWAKENLAKLQANQSIGEEQNNELER